MLHKGDYVIRQSMENVIIFFEDVPQLQRRINDIMEISTDLQRCFVGEKSNIALKSVQSVEKVMKMAEATKNDQQVISYDDLRLECLLSEITEDNVIRDIMEKLTQNDANHTLQHTILVYADTNEDQKKTCSMLFIHRNTLNYRLDKIEELTGLNPRNGKNLILLYIAVIHLRLKV